MQLGLGLVLFRGLQVHAVQAPGELVSRLINVTLPPPPPIPSPKPIQRAKVVRKHKTAAPAPRQPNPGGSPGPAPHGKAIVPKIAVPAPAAAPAGGGRGTGASVGNGSGGGGGEGEGDGGADLEKIAGDIYDSDYPPNLAAAGIGGRVDAEIEVGTDGRVKSCRVTHSSGNAQLDGLTCRIIQQRYRFRPSTDRYGRPIPDEADVSQDWGRGR